MSERRHFWQTPYVDWVSRAPENCVTLIMHLRRARLKAKVVAVVEALCLLQDLGVQALIGGPLAERVGVFWLALPKDHIKAALARLPHLGYVQAVDLLQPAQSSGYVLFDALPPTSPTEIRWRKRKYHLLRIYEEDPEALRQSAPDKRVFLFQTATGEVRPVRGYRGSSSPLARRGLPVYDARMLVNLVSRGTGGLFLDPFAGIGGILLEAVNRGHAVISADIDPELRHGLARLSAAHTVANAASLPFTSATFDAIATELPFHESTETIIVQGLREMYRVLKEGGRLALMCAEWQSRVLVRQAQVLDLVLYLDAPINRKGLNVSVLAWRKGLAENMSTP